MTQHRPGGRCGRVNESYRKGFRVEKEEGPIESAQASKPQKDVPWVKDLLCLAPVERLN